MEGSVRYKLLTHEDKVGLMLMVEMHLDAGWELQGGVSMISHTVDVIVHTNYGQAVTKQ